MAILHKIPSKQLHRVAPDLDTLVANLDNREIGFCTTDKCAYIKFDGELFPMGQGLPEPNGLSFLIGEKIEEGEGEDASVRSVYGWQPAEQESFSTPQTNELVLWTKIYGKGFAADIAFMDKYGRDIAELLDYSNVFVAEYDETTFADIADAVSGGKIVILKNGGTGKFTPMSTWSSGGCTFVTPVDAYGVYHSYNVALDDTWTDVPVSIGEDTPTENSDKLLTSGGAYTALEEKANATNITPGTFTKVSVNSQGVVTNGQQLDANDIPNHSADKLTEGYLHPDRLEDGSIPAEKLEIRKKLMVDGTTITAVEHADSVVLKATGTSSGNVAVVTNDNTFVEVKALYDAGVVPIYKDSDGYYYVPTRVTTSSFVFSNCDTGSAGSGEGGYYVLEKSVGLISSGWGTTTPNNWEMATTNYVDDRARGDIGSYDNTKDIHKVIAGRPGYLNSVVIHIDRDSQDVGKLYVKFDGALNSWAVGATGVCMVCNARARESLAVDDGGADTFKQTADILNGAVSSSTSYTHTLTLYSSGNAPTNYGVTLDVHISFLVNGVRYYAKFDIAIYNVGAQSSIDEVFMGHGDLWKVSVT